MGFMSGMTGLQIAQGVTSLGSTLFGWQNQRENAKRQAEALSKQAGAAVKRMAYAFQNYEMQRVDAFDAAVNNLMKVRQGSMGLLSSVRAAVNEETGGDSRTGRALERAANADVLRTETSIKDNYARQSDEINLNKEAVKLQTQDMIDSIRAQAPEMPSVWGLVGNLAATGLSWYNGVENQNAARDAVLGAGYMPNPPRRYHFDGYPNYVDYPTMSDFWNYNYKGVRW